jgi:hypothetical protein
MGLRIDMAQDIVSMACSHIITAESHDSTAGQVFAALDAVIALP